MPKQTKSNNNAALKGFALTLVILILAVCVMAAMTDGFVNWNPYGWFDEEPAAEEQPDADNPAEESAPINAAITNSEHVMLTMSMATTAAEDGYTKSVTLTATVMPEDAPDKSVDWSIAWNEAPTYGDNPVTDYVTVTPQSDGSNVATVTCLQPFGTDTIIVTVTTRNGGYTATARVSYEGLPTELGFDTATLSQASADNWGVTIYEAACGGTYTVPITLDNGFHEIGEDFTPNYTITIEGIGDVTYKARRTTYNRNGGVVSSTFEEYTQAIGADVIGSEIYGSKVLGNPLDDLATIEIIGTNVVITPKNALSALTYVDYQTSTLYVRSTDFTAADESKAPYIQIKVTETNTGVSQILNVRIIASVTGVSISNDAIAF